LESDFVRRLWRVLMASNANAVEKGLLAKQEETKLSQEAVQNNVLDFFEVKYNDLKYTLDDKNQKIILGKGTFGVVYHGTWRYSSVAIKELFIDHVSDDVVEAFKNEARVMSRLRSEHLVKLSGYCLSPRYCLVMEYAPGGSLDKLLASKETIDWGLKYQIATDVAIGVAFLHAENILHRDIKSLNVLLDANKHAKLTDFGLSKVKQASKSSTAGSAGTVLWMAPELFERTGKYTQKSDIYSLGMVFWEIAARALPFADVDDPTRVPPLVMRGERETIPQDCPKKFSSLIKSCWKGKPEERPSADAVVQYLHSKEADNFEKFAAELVAQKVSTVQPSMVSSGVKNGVSSGFLNNFASMAVSPNQAAFEEQAKKLRELELALAQRDKQLEQRDQQLQQLQPILEYVKAEQQEKEARRIENEKRLAQRAKTLKDAQTFVEHVVWGREDEAQAMLKENAEVALVACEVTDTAGRTFKQITGFQYAVWALDWKMWTMIKAYLPNDAAQEQAKGFKEGEWVKEHKEHVEWKNLLDAQECYTARCYTTRKAARETVGIRIGVVGQVDYRQALASLYNTRCQQREKLVADLVSVNTLRSPRK